VIMKLNTKSVTQAAALLTLTSGMALAASENTNACAGGYSMTDVNNDGYISPIEANTYAKRQSVDMDTDQSGTVSREEYVNCASEKFADTELERTDALADIDTLDTNQDGFIGPAEYLQHAAETVQKATGGDAEAASQSDNLVYRLPEESKLDYDTAPLEELVSRSKTGFLMLDADQSGSLDESEYKAPVFKPVDISNVLNGDFDAVDTDASDDLTQTELIAANVKQAEYAMEEAEKQTGEKMNPEIGAPVVYYTYPHPM